MRDAGWPAATGSLPEALEAAHDACATSAAARGVGIAIENAVIARVGIDTDWLTLVLVNLIDNAIKRGRPGGDVFVSVDVRGRYVRVTIDNDGPGIAGTERERVFAFGERAETTAQGSGIGLAAGMKSFRVAFIALGGHVASVRRRPLVAFRVGQGA